MNRQITPSWRQSENSFLPFCIIHSKAGDPGNVRWGITPWSFVGMTLRKLCKDLMVSIIEDSLVFSDLRRWESTMGRTVRTFSRLRQRERTVNSTN